MGLRLHSRRPCPGKFVCRRAKNAGYEDYKFPDPIPEFAEQETSKFREHMAWRLEQKKEDYFGEHVEEIVDICTEYADARRMLADMKKETTTKETMDLFPQNAGFGSEAASRKPLLQANSTKLSEGHHPTT